MEIFLTGISKKKKKKNFKYELWNEESQEIPYS